MNVGGFVSGSTPTVYLHEGGTYLPGTLKGLLTVTSRLTTATL